MLRSTMEKEMLEKRQTAEEWLEVALDGVEEIIASFWEGDELWLDVKVNHEYRRYLWYPEEERAVSVLELKERNERDR